MLVVLKNLVLMVKRPLAPKIVPDESLASPNSLEYASEHKACIVLTREQYLKRCGQIGMEMWNGEW
jgi:hypothetical protein